MNYAQTTLAYLQKASRLFVTALLLTSVSGGFAQDESEIVRPKFGVTSIAFSPDRKTLVVVRGDFVLQRYVDYRRVVHTNANGQVEIWDISSASLTRRLDFTGPVRRVVFSHDGKRIATASLESFDPKKLLSKDSIRGSSEGIIKVWDVATGELKWTKPAYPHDVLALAFSHDGKTLASSGVLPSKVLFWNAETGELIRDRVYMSPVAALAYSPDGSMLAIRKRIYSELRGEVKIHDARTLKEKWTFKEPKQINDNFPWQMRGGGSRTGGMKHMAFSPDGKSLAIAINYLGPQIFYSIVELWDLQTGKLKQAIKAQATPLEAIAFSSDGQSLRTANLGVAFRLWDAGTGNSTQVGRSDKPATAVAFSPDNQIAIADYDGTVRLWNTLTGELSQTMVGPELGQGTMTVGNLMVSVERVLSVAFSPDGKTLASSGDRGIVMLWDALSAQEKSKLTGHQDTVATLALSRDGKVIASGGEDQTIKLWEAETGNLKRTLKGHTGPVNCVALSPDSRLLVSAAADKTVRLWDIETGEAKTVFNGQAARVSSVAFSIDGARVFGAGEDGALNIWDVRSGNLERASRGTTVPVLSLAVAPDGKSLATAGADGAIRVWDTGTYQVTQILKGHDGAIHTVAFSPDGRFIATGGEDKTVRLWDATTWKPRRTLKGHDMAVYTLAFSPDGAVLASGSGNDTVVFWDWQSGEVKQVLRGGGRIPVRRAKGSL
jgi:WD40 repeat protein